MDKDMKEATGRFKEAMERIRAGESDAEEVDLPSGRVRLTLDGMAPSGIRIEPLDVDPEGDAAGELDPERKAIMERIREATERFRAEELDSIEIPLTDGGTLEISRDADVPGALIMRSSEGGPALRTVSFEASATRPPHYPDDLPFLADRAVALTEAGERRFFTLNWFDPADPEGALGELRRQLVEDGWDEGEESRASSLQGTTASTGFRKGDQARIVTVYHLGDHTQISLMEAPGPAGEGES